MHSDSSDSSELDLPYRPRLSIDAVASFESDSDLRNIPFSAIELPQIPSKITSIRNGVRLEVGSHYGFRQEDGSGETSDPSFERTDASSGL